MAPSYIVTAPLVVIPDNGGSDRYLYQGTPVPEDVNQDHLKSLVDGGLVEESKAAAELEPVEEEPEDQAPAKSASKAEWEEYARSQGATDADLEGQTKDDLIAAYGG